MTQFNIDLEDGKPPVTFNLKPEDATRFMAFMSRYQLMERTLAKDLEFLVEYSGQLVQTTNLVDNWINELEKLEPQEPWQRNDERTESCTMLIGSSHFNGPVTLERIAAWTDDQCKAVEEYCLALHIQASDNDDYPIPEKPAVMTEEVPA